MEILGYPGEADRAKRNRLWRTTRWRTNRLSFVGKLGGQKGAGRDAGLCLLRLVAAESGPFANGSWESSPATITEAHWQAMQRVVEYLERDEIRNWVEAGQPDKHIWLSVRELQDLLKQAGKIPNIANFWETADGDLVSDGHGDD